MGKKSKKITGAPKSPPKNLKINGRNNDTFSCSWSYASDYWKSSNSTRAQAIFTQWYADTNFVSSPVQTKKVKYAKKVKKPR